MVIQAMLDDIYRITDEMSQDIAEAIDAERQAVMRNTGWNDMELTELVQIYRGPNNRLLPWEVPDPNVLT